MTIGVPAFRGGRLKEARLARGLFKNALGDMVGLTGTAITRYEDGHDNPQLDRLERLAAALNFPIQFFLQPEWPESIELVFWRSRAVETRYAREMTEQRMIWLCELFSCLERELDFPTFDIPDLSLPKDFRQLTGSVIEGAAEKLRAYWNLGIHPIPDVILVLENAGIPVVNLDIMSDKQDGFCFRSSMLSRVFVGINKDGISAARARYDAAHELGHAVLHRYVTPQQSRDPMLHKMMEQQAFRFAGAFLFPRECFRSEVRVPTLDYFSSLKKRWGMSINAMVYRAFDLELIDEFEKTALYRNLGRRGWRGRLQEPFDGPEDMPIERPRMLRRAVDVMLSSNIFGRASFQAALGLPAREIESLVGLEPGFLSKDVDPVPFIKPKRSTLQAVEMESGKVIEFPKRYPQ